MKKFFFIVIIVFVGCNPSDDENADDNTFTVSITQDLSSVVIDQMVTLTANTNEPIKSIDYSIDGGITFGSEYSTNFGNTAKLYLDFDTVGTKNIVFRIKNNDGDVVDKAIDINVEQGNAIQITSLKLNAFYNMGETWDTEFNDTDVNRLADVFFVILKPRLDVYKGTRNSVPSSSWLWFRSQTRNNESNLNWDLQNEDLYINIEQLTPYIAFGDDDGGNIGQELIPEPPYERIIPISDYIDTKPSSILVEETNVNLEYEIGISW